MKELISAYKPEQLSIRIILWSQPWHPHSYYLAHAALTVWKLQPTLFSKYSDLIFSKSEAIFSEASAKDLKKSDFQIELTSLATSLGIDKSMFEAALEADMALSDFKFHQRYG